MSISVIQSSMPPYEEYCAEIKDLWESRWLTNMGAKHEKLICALKEYLGVEELDLLANGHTALEFALAALELPEGGEVITTPFTFASTTHAIAQNGLRPVFCDIDPETFTLNPAEIERLVSEKTCAIVPVHVYGSVCDVETIQQIADRHGLKVIYDAAHAFGVTYHGVSAASFGDAAMFSFHATKVFHTVEGGAVVYRDPAFGQRLKAMKNFGMTGHEDVPYVGGNAKMTEVHAAMGLCNLRHVDEEIARRRRVEERYRERLEGTPGLQFKPVQPEVRSNYAYFPVVFDPERFGADRDTVVAALAEQEIFARKYFYPLTNTFACYAKDYDAARQTPVALRISQRVLCLPMYADLALSDVDRICDVVLRCRGAV